MRRTRGELRILVDAAQIVLVVAFLVDLALPWVTRANSQYPPNGTWTGWASLAAGTGAGGLAWLAAVPMLLVTFAALVRVRRLSIVAGALALLPALLLVYSVAREHGFGPHVLDPHAGLWVGLLLVVMGAGLCFATARLSRDPELDRPPLP